MIITPRPGWLLVRQVCPDEINGIKVPMQFAGQQARCEVVAAGSEVNGIVAGDWVLVAREHTALAADPSDEDLFLMPDEDVTAVVIYEAEDDARVSLIASHTTAQVPS